MRVDFWQQLPTPFFVLAPMEDVTDAAFRRLIAEHGKPDVMYTEFTSADGLTLADKAGRKKLLKKLAYSEEERPIVAQLFSAVPERMEKASALARELGFDGVDINMGCPDKSVEKQGCGSAMIKNPALAVEVIRAAKRGSEGLPISVKTRAGYARDEELDTWARVLLAEDIAALAIHARTRKDMSKVPARWELVRRTVEIRDAMGADTFVIGNGDVKDIADAHAKAKEYGCDGVMLGRAIFGNPFLFSHSRELENSAQGHIQTLMRHLGLFDELLSDTANYATMKKHFKAYITGWDGAKELRMRLMETESPEEALAVLAEEVRGAHLSTPIR
jgi:nifR3 family TIM-barrel protein